MMSEERPLLTIRDLRVGFDTLEGRVTALSILRLLPERSTRISGSVGFEGLDLLRADKETMLGIRGASIAMIFQEPMTSLNPIMTIGRQIQEAVAAHERLADAEALERAVRLLERVQIPAPAARVRDYPFALSGGMRQRAMIAMALSCRPKLLLADEPTTALDVTIQAQILELMKEIKRDTGASILLITHDLGLIAEMASRVTVMYAGLVVEEAWVKDLFAESLHPYTRGLLGSIPVLGRKFREGRARLQEIPGVVPGPGDMPAGCRFHPRCREGVERCRAEAPPMIALNGKRKVRCWLHA